MKVVQWVLCCTAKTYKHQWVQVVHGRRTTTTIRDENY